MDNNNLLIVSNLSVNLDLFQLKFASFPFVKFSTAISDSFNRT